MSYTLLTCGGTVAISSLSTEFLSELPRPTEIVDVFDMDFSQQLPAHWARLVAATRTAANSGLAVVISHGTDTLVWSAAALAVAGPWPVPVVLTASNVPATSSGSDAAINLAAAIGCASLLSPGVWVVFNGTTDPERSLVFQGGFVTKLYGSGQAFVSRTTPYACWDSRNLTQLGELVPIGLFATDLSFSRRVELVTSTPILTPIQLPSPPPHVCVIESYVCGTVPPTALTIAKQRLDAGIPVVCVAPSPIASAPYPSTAALADLGVDAILDASVELVVAASAGGWLP